MSEETPVVDLEANLFRAATICASTEELRPYICCVRIEKHPIEGALLIATDGCRMVVIRDRNAWVTKPISVCLDRALLAACKPSKFGVGPRLKIFADGTATVGELRSSNPVIVKGDYPEWRKVVPVQKWENVPVSLNGKYVGDFTKIKTILMPGNPAIRMFAGSDDTQPVLVLFPDFGDAFGILMPMRADVREGLPSWMRPVMAKKKAAAKRAAKKKKAKRHA